MTALDSPPLARRQRGALGLSPANTERLSYFASAFIRREPLCDYGRIPLYDPALPLVVFFSQKAACTTVVKWYFSKLGLLEQAERHAPWIHHYENEVFKRRAGYMRDVRAAIAAGAPVIKVTREPIARIYSGYLTLYAPRAVRSEDRHWASFWRAKALAHAYGARVPNATPLSFNQYLAWLADADSARMNGHFAPQYCAADRLLGDKLTYAKIEDGLAMFRTLEQRYELTETDEAAFLTFSESHHNHKKIAADRADVDEVLERGLPTDPLALNRRPRLDFAAVQHSQETLGLLRRCFSDDLTRLGYAYGA